jgi:hypothetical protein
MVAVAALAALVTACADPSFVPEENEVIFSESVSQQLASQEPTSFPPSGPYWTPSSAHVQEANTRILEFLASQDAKRARQLYRRLSTYYAQYVGGTEDQTRIVYVNGFCDAKSHHNWRTEFVTAMDGGICYFDAKYDPTAKQLVHFSVHFPHYWESLQHLNAEWSGRDRIGK